MADLKTDQQGEGGFKSGMTRKGEQGDHNEGAEFGTRAASTRGTDRDADDSGTSKNQGHGHPRNDGGSDQS